MKPKPDLFASDYGAWFNDPLVVEAYPERPPYPGETIDLLAQLVLNEPRRVLDVGCGTGELARRLAPRVQHIDAIDASASMLVAAQSAPGGDAPNLTWIHSRVEDAALDTATYGLVTAGESLHWLEWHAVLPDFARALAPGGMVTIIERDWDGPPALRERLLPIFKRYAHVRAWQTVSLIDELQARSLFQQVGRHLCGPETWRPTMASYIAARHSQRSFSRTHMGDAAVHAFDAELLAALESACAADEIECDAGRLLLSVTATVTWGRPLG
ncbi:MAG: class I SAM-dependent methyltransferase [Chloroflexi bacterium]|nr:class I SAM-dependent methyltransferase [Chloroflexota bacterium]